MSHRKISAALSTHLSTMVGIPSVAWENAPFEPVSGAIYLAESYLPATTAPVGIADDSSDQFVGVYQVSVFARSDMYKLDAHTLADSVIEHFARGSTVLYEGQAVRIESSSIAPSQLDGDRFIIPVSINWRSFA